MLQMKKGHLLRKGIAAFLLLVLACSSLAFATESEDISTTETQENQQLEEEQAEENESLETVESVKVDMDESEGKTMIFAQDEPVNKTVKLDHSRTIRYEYYSTQDFHAICDGEKVIAYCIEPTVKFGGRKEYSASAYSAPLMTKALYYSYGSPGFSKKTEQYLSGVERKACYKGDDGAYALCHIMLSYIYDGEGDNTDAFKGCTDGTKEVVKDLIAAIKAWPDPDETADISLSSNKVNATWNEKDKVQETPEIKVNGTEGNSITVPVPEGASINKGDGKATEGSVNVAVGESFSVSASADKRGTYNSPAIISTASGFQPYIVEPNGEQSQIFNLATPDSVSYSIEWMNFGKVELIKTSSDSGTSDGNGYYSLKGAKYGLYSKATDKKCADLITDDEGKAAVDNVPYGEYYLKELEPSRGYELDIASHDITVGSPAQSETVLEKPSVPEITTSAEVSDTGESSATEGGMVKITDTVIYSGVEPGLEYSIAGRLMNKATGKEVPGTTSIVKFTPETSNGSLKMDYNVNSNGLGGNTVVAFEKLYQNGNLIATHEDINNKAQSVNFVKPKDNSPGTGDESDIWMAALVLAMSLMLGIGMIALKN